jgi:2,4-dienoyl-CoA reductase-like NADH-dependent reductase (Old Yellow Enzyme family)
MDYSKLLSPVDVGSVTLRNRVMSSGHQTTLVEDNLPTDDFAAYHLARARGGAGLVVLEAHAVQSREELHGTVLDAGDDAIVAAYEPLVAEMHDAGCRVFAQLLEDGRERPRSGYDRPAVAPSDAPTERYHVVPRPMTTEEVYEMIDSYAAAARRMADAGLDGVEIGGSHGYLVAQFWSEHVNDRDDEFGGDLASRCRFATAIVDRIRERVGDDFVVGMRASLGERHERGLSLAETLDVVEQIDGAADLDYWSFVVGSSSTYRSSQFIVPPANTSAEVVADPVAAVDDRVDGRVIVTSRIDSPDRAERTLRERPVDVVGMTRAMIADPELVRKTREGDRGDVTPCVACNQGCIGRYHEGLPIRCTVNPVTGRERTYTHGRVDPAAESRSVVVVGGGPAGMIAASTAARRGHDVTLVEADEDLGGQVRHYAGLAHRGRFDEWLSVETARLRDAGVTVRTGERVEADDLDPAQTDAVVLATGAVGRIPDVPIRGDADVLTAREALDDPARVGHRVVVSDWDGRKPALDVAQTLVADHDVEVVTETYAPGEAVQQYTRSNLLGDLDAAGCTFTPRHRVAGVDGSTVELGNLFSEESTVREGVDTVVFAHRGKASTALYDELRGSGLEVTRVGDCWAPRSLDEAVREAFETATSL